MTKTFHCTFTAQLGSRAVRSTHTVRATDVYSAQDAIVKRLGTQYAKLTYPVFQFGKTHARLTRATSAALAGAGAEES